MLQEMGCCFYVLMFWYMALVSRNYIKSVNFYSYHVNICYLFSILFLFCIFLKKRILLSVIHILVCEFTTVWPTSSGLGDSQGLGKTTTFSGGRSQKRSRQVFFPINTYLTLEDIQSTSQIDGLVQERRNSSALAMELRLSWWNHIGSFMNVMNHC